MLVGMVICEIVQDLFDRNPYLEMSKIVSVSISWDLCCNLGKSLHTAKNNHHNSFFSMRFLFKFIPCIFDIVFVRFHL